MTRVAIVGAGIIGACIAYRLAKAGAAVTLIDRDGPGAGASGKSFAWINANAPEPGFYNRFRQGAIAAWRRMETEVTLPIRWGGCLSWEFGGNALRAQAEALAAAGCAARMIAPGEADAIVPPLAADFGPAMFVEDDGAIDAAQAAAKIGDAAAEAGAVRVLGADATGFIRQGERIAGVTTDAGDIAADLTILAAGIGSTALATHAGIDLPLGAARGLIVRTKPVDAVLGPVILTPDAHFRQEMDGSLLVAEDFSGAGQNADQIAVEPQALAASVLTKLRRLLPGVRIELSEILIGARPDPADGLPIIGPLADGLYVAAMHSGVTLAAHVGELVAAEALGKPAEALAPFRPTRFSE